MNAERLLALLQHFSADFAATKAIDHMVALRDALQNMVNQPGQPEYQKQLTESLAKFQTATSASYFNYANQDELDIINELDLSKLMPSEMLESIQSILQRNQMTPAVALEDLSKYIDSTNKIKKLSDSTANGLDKLGVYPVDVEPGESQIQILMPRAAIHDDLDGYGREVRVFYTILKTFNEVVTGEAGEFKLKSVSSSDFLFYVTALAPTLLALAKCLDLLAGAYLKVMQGREVHKSLKESAILSEDTLNKMSEDLKKHVQKSIEDARDKILLESAKQTGRAADLDGRVIHALQQIAIRIEKGYDFRVVAEEKDEDDLDNDQAAIAHNNILRELREWSQSRKTVRFDGPPLLELPPPTDSNRSV